MPAPRLLLPLYQDHQPYLRNRLMMTVLPLIMIVLTTPQVLMFLVRHVVTVAPQQAVRNAIEDLVDNTPLNLTATLNERINELYQEQVQVYFPMEVVPAEEARIASVHQRNHDTLAQLDLQNKTLWELLILLQSEVASHTSASSSSVEASTTLLKYNPGATEDDIDRFERTFGVTQSIQERHVESLRESSSQLKDSIRANLNYNRDYAANKTRVLREAVLRIKDELNAPLLLELDDLLRAELDETWTSLRASLLSIRSYLARVYKDLSADLQVTREQLEDLIALYSELLEDAQNLAALISEVRIPLLGSIVDIPNFSRYPPGFSFDTPTLNLPAVEDYLKNLDELIFSLETSFDLLLGRIKTDFSDTLDAAVDAIVAKLEGLATLNDYHPPPIIFNGTQLTTDEAFELDAQLLEDITVAEGSRIRNNFAGFEFNIPDFMFEIPEINIDLTATPFAFTESVLDVLFELVVPPVAMQIWAFVTMLVSMLVKWPIIFYRFYQQIYQYWAGTAVQTPVVEMRTKAEIEAEKKWSKKNTFILLTAQFFADQQFVRIFLWTVASLAMTAGVIFLVNYERTENQPNCVQSNTGTSLARELVLPLVVNQAGLAARATRTLRNEDLRQLSLTHCRRLTEDFYSQYGEDSARFETLRASAVLALDQVNLVQRVLVNFDDFCGDCSSTLAGLELPTSLNSNATDCEDLEPEWITNQIVPAAYLDETQLVEDVCVIEWFVLSSIWTFFGILFSYAILSLAWHCLATGIHILKRRQLQPEQYHLNVTCDGRGIFTQEEYGSVKTRETAIMEHAIGIDVQGRLYVVAGAFLILFFLGTGCHLVFNFTSVPIWWDGSIYASTES